MKDRIYRIGYDQVNKRELLERLGIHDGLLLEHRWIHPSSAQEAADVYPEEQRHAVLVRYPRKPSEWIHFNGFYEISARDPIPWLDLPMVYHQYGNQLIPGSIRREKAPQARVPARTKLMVSAIRADTVFVTVPGHPSRRYELSLSHARFAKDVPTELELRLQVFAFPPRPDILVDWLLAEGRKSAMVTLADGSRAERSAFQVWDELRQEYGLSVSAALIAIKQALVVLDRAGIEYEFPYPISDLSDLTHSSEAERDAFYSYHAVRAAMAAVSGLLTTDPQDPLQDLLLMEVMLESQMKRKRE